MIRLYHGNDQCSAMRTAKDATSAERTMDPRDVNRTEWSEDLQEPKSTTVEGIERPNRASAEGIEQPKSTTVEGIERPDRASAEGIEQPKSTTVEGMERPNRASAEGTQRPDMTLVEGASSPRPHRGEDSRGTLRGVVGPWHLESAEARGVRFQAVQCGAVIAVEAVDALAEHNLETLRLQSITPKEAKAAIEGFDPAQPLTDDLVKLIKKHQELDPFCMRIARQKLPHRRQLIDPPVDVPLIVPEAEPVLGKGLSGLLCVAGRVIVPEQASLRHELLRQFHDSPAAGHFGEHRTKELLQRYFYWTELGTDVKEWIATCPQCQGKAIHRHKPYGKLEPFVPTDGDYRPFRHISVDWITGLPESRRQSTGEVFNAILTVVCRITKAARFIPTRSNTTAGDFARLFFENIECEYGTPTSIVSDRDSRITSEFWTEVCSQMIIKRRLSTAFHPQTDGQSEALNRIVEDYLRAYCADEPTAWVNLLPLARFAYNNSINAATKTTPNNLLFGMDCSIRFNVEGNAPRERIPEAKARIERLHELRQKLREHLAQANERMTKYYNRNHVPMQFSTKQLVKLSTRNLKFKYPKLAPRWIGPFRITERIGAQAYRLALPTKYARLHDVFPVQLLEAYHPRKGEDPLPMPDLAAEDNEWEVQEIRDSKRFDGILHYLVKWTGWPCEYDSWEPAENLENAPDKIWEFEKRHNSRKRRRRTIGVDQG
jgi:transposase InsO family protein